MYIKNFSASQKWNICFPDENEYPTNIECKI